MDGVTRLWAMRRSKWDGADGGLCSRRVCAEGAYEEEGQRVYRRSGVWDGKTWVRNLGGLCSRRVWVGDAPDGGARLRMVNGAFSVCLTCLRIANGMFGI